MNWFALLLIFLFLPASLYSQTPEPPSPPSSPQSSPAPPTKPTPQNPKTPEEFFARARQLSDLEATGIPFHLKATYVASGDAEFTGNGTYEEWWQSKDIWRKEATLGDFRYVAIDSGGDPKIFSSSAYIPLRLRQVLESIIIRVPADLGSSGDWKMQKKTIQDVELTALSDLVCEPETTDQHQANRGKKHKHQGGDQCFRQDLFTPEGILRIRQRESDRAIYNDFHQFQDLLIPRDIRVGNAEGWNLKITIDTLEIWIADQQSISHLAEIPAALQPSMGAIYVTQGVTPPRVTHAVEPIIPDDIRLRNQITQESVIITATIDEKGNMREAYVLRSGGPLLDKSALNAVRQYKFAPAKFRGNAIAFNISITVDFHFE